MEFDKAKYLHGNQPSEFECPFCGKKHRFPSMRVKGFGGSLLNLLEYSERYDYICLQCESNPKKLFYVRFAYNNDGKCVCIWRVKEGIRYWKGQNLMNEFSDDEKGIKITIKYNGRESTFGLKFTLDYEYLLMYVHSLKAKYEAKSTMND